MSVWCRYIGINKMVQASSPAGQPNLHYSYPGLSKVYEMNKIDRLRELLFRGVHIRVAQSSNTSRPCKRQERPPSPSATAGHSSVTPCALIPQHRTYCTFRYTAPPRYVRNTYANNMHKTIIIINIIIIKKGRQCKAERE